MSTIPDPENGPQMLSSILARFRYANPADIKHLSNDRPEMVRYLAKTHDLTPAEAGETLNDCCFKRRAPIAKAA